MKETIRKRSAESTMVTTQAVARNEQALVTAAYAICEALRAGRKVLIFGNGGSAADSQHIAAEFIGRFQKERRAFAAIALTTDTSILTALSNDYSGEIVFSRQIEGLGAPGDIAWGISTSGNSANVIAGIKKARERGLKTMSFTGKDGGALAALSEISIIAPSDVTARIQEAHMCMAHILCELVEEAMIQ